MTPTVLYWVSQLAVFGGTVSGVVQSFDLPTIPQKINRDMLPCLMPFLALADDVGYEPLTFVGGSPKLDFQVKHRLFCEEKNTNKPLAVQLPAWFNFIDTYVAAAMKKKIIDSQPGPPFNQTMIKFKVKAGSATYGDINYLTIDFVHDVCLYLS